MRLGPACAILALLLTQSSVAATYYFAANGNDTRTVAEAQNQATPWQTLTKLNSLSLQPGDRVLLQRGDRFSGGILISQSGTAGSPIVLGAYGTGSAPVVSGSVPVSGWQAHQGPIYVATYTGDGTKPVEQVFADGKPLVCARTPNQGYWTVDSVTGASSFISNALKGATNWTGAALHIKMERWSLYARVIATHHATTGAVTLNSAPNTGPVKGWGFFINNSLAALDQAGEWYYDSTSKKLYVWMPSGGMPSGIEGSVMPYGLDISGRSYVTVQDLCFRGHSMTAIRCYGNHITVKNCVAEYADGYGMQLYVSDSRIEGCTVKYSNFKGVDLNGARNLFAGNTIKGIGMLPRLNRRGLGGGCCSARGLDFGGGSDTVRGNVLDSIGYIGIGFGGENNLIEHNVVSRFCMTTDDGSGIYTWSDNFDSPGAAGTVIRRNIVVDGIGTAAGTPADWAPQGFANGIYMDDRTHHITIDSNTCIRNQIGLFLHNNRYHTARGNVCYANREAQITYQRDGIVSTNVYGNRVIDNVCFSTAETQSTIRESRYAANDSALARLSGNVECVETPFGVECTRDGVSLWRQSYYEGQTSAIGGNKIANGEFDSSSLAWGCWPSQYFALAVDSTASPDGRCLRIRYFGNPDSGAPIVFTTVTYALTKGSLYRLRFSAKENHAGQMYLTARLAHTSYASVGLQRTVTLDTAWKRFELFFECSTTDPQCRVDFYPSRTDTLIWLDSVSLYEISTAGVTKELRSAVFCNDSAIARQFSLGRDSWRDVYGRRSIKGAISLPAYLSQVLVKDSLNVLSVGAPGCAQGRARLTVAKARVTRGGAIRVDFALDAPQDVRVDVHNSRGEAMASLAMVGARAGSHSRVLRPAAGAWSAGSYVVRVQTGAGSRCEHVVSVR